MGGAQDIDELHLKVPKSLDRVAERAPINQFHGHQYAVDLVGGTPQLTDRG